MREAWSQVGIPPICSGPVGRLAILLISGDEPHLKSPAPAGFRCAEVERTELDTTGQPTPHTGRQPGRRDQTRTALYPASRTPSTRSPSTAARPRRGSPAERRPARELLIRAIAGRRVRPHAGEGGLGGEFHAGRGPCAPGSGFTKLFRVAARSRSAFTKAQIEKTGVPSSLQNTSPAALAAHDQKGPPGLRGCADQRWGL